MVILYIIYCTFCVLLVIYLSHIMYYTKLNFHNVNFVRYSVCNINLGGIITLGLPLLKDYKAVSEWSWAQLDKCSISIKLDYVVGSYQTLVKLPLSRLLDVLVVGLIPSFTTEEIMENEINESDSIWKCHMESCSNLNTHGKIHL